MNFKAHLHRFYAAAIVACLGLGLAPLERWSPGYLGSGSSLSALHWLQAALLLVALCLAVYAIALRSANVISLDSALFHLLGGLLIVHSSCLLIQFWKYVTGQVSERWSEQIIFLSAAQSDGISDLYSISHLVNPPFRVSIYPPIYYAVQKLLFLPFGRTLLIGRYVSATAVLMTAVLLIFASPKPSEKSQRLLIPLLFLSIFPVMALNAGSLVKPEFLAICFSVAGLVVYLNRGLGEGRRWILLCSVLCALALLTKPTVFPVSAAIVIHLLWDSRYKECARFVSIVLSFLLVVYAFLYWRTGGGIWLMTIVGNALKTTPSKILYFGFERYMLNPFVVLAVAACAILLSEGKDRKQVPVLLSIYFSIALPWFIVSVAKPGSSYSYFLDVAVAGSLVIGTLILKCVAEKNRTCLRLMLVIVSVSMFAYLPKQIGLTARNEDGRGEHDQVVRLLTDLKAGQDEYILSDAYYTADVIEAGHRALINDNLQYTAMSNNRTLSLDPLMRLLRGRLVPYLILENTLDWHSGQSDRERYWPNDVLEYMKRNYTCTTVMTRNDGRYLVICKLNP